MDRKILITGAGIVSSLGNNTFSVEQMLEYGACGLHHDPARSEKGYQSDLCGKINDPNPWMLSGLTRAQRQCLSEPTLYSLSAVNEALVEANIGPEFLQSHNVSVIVSNDSTAGESYQAMTTAITQRDTRRLGAAAVFRTLNSTVSMNLASIYGLKGLSLTVSGACAGGGHAITLAKMLLDTRQTEMVIVVGAQETGPFSMLSFDAMGVFSPDKVQPFGKGRNGLAPSGGAACVILEPSDSMRFEDYKVSPVAELSGCGFSTNGTNICTPDAYQEEVAMIKAIESAGLDAGMIDVLLAHATGTEQGDAAAAEAIGKVFPESPYIVATKGMTGHECWMAGVSQAVQAAMMLNTNTIFGAATTAENAFPNLNLVMQSRDYSAHHILCNAFGFGGTNSSFIISKYQPS